MVTTTKTSQSAIIKIPLSALRCLLTYPKDKKALCEIDLKTMKKHNKPETLDEIINEGRIDYALGNY
jgi:hypothetical protein